MMFARVGGMAAAKAGGSRSAEWVLLRNALTLACRRRGLPTSFGRGFDDLPTEVLEAFEGTLVPSLSRNALLGALAASVQGLLRESAEVDEAAKVEPRLRELLTAD